MENINKGCLHKTKERLTRKRSDFYENKNNREGIKSN